MTELIGGTDTYLLWSVESTFKTSVAPTSHFGSVESARFRKTRNLQLIHGMAATGSTGQLPRRTLKGNYEGTGTVTYKAIDWNHLTHIMGARTGAGTSGDPYVYAFSSKPSSYTIGHMMNDATTDERDRHAGCLARSFTLRFQQGQAPTCTMEYFVASIAVSTTLDAQQSLQSGSEYNFDGGSLELPTSSVITDIIESGTLTVTREVKPLYGVGSETAGAYVYGKTTVALQVSINWKDAAYMTAFLGSATALSSISSYATARLAFSNGASKYLYANFTNLTIADHDMNDNLNDPLKVDLSFTAENLSFSERVS